MEESTFAFILPTAANLHPPNNLQSPTIAGNKRAAAALVNTNHFALRIFARQLG